MIGAKHEASEAVAADEDAPNGASAYPRPLVAWTSAGLMTLMFALAYMDRQVISLMVGPISAEFGPGVRVAAFERVWRGPNLRRPGSPRLSGRLLEGQR